MAEIQGNIRSILGEVKVLRASGEEVLLKEGDQIFAGDTVMTGADASAYIEFPAVDGKTPTEGILQANSTAKLTATDSGALLDVSEGSFELLSDGENQSVAVTGGGMAGLLGAGILAGGPLGALAAAAGAAFLISEDNDGGNGSTDMSAAAVPASVQTLADATGPVSPTVTEAYTDLGVATVATNDALTAASPITDSAEPILDETAPVVDAASPILEPTNGATMAALDGLSPVTTSLNDNLGPTTTGLTDALAPATDVLLGTEGSGTAAAADTLPVNVRVIAENVAAGLDQAAPQIADAVNQLVTALEPVLGPLKDGAQQLADALAPLFDGLAQGTGALPMATEPLAGGLDQAFGALEPVLTPVNDGLASFGGGGSTDGGPLPTDTGTPLDDVFTQINDAIAMFQGAAGGGETSDGGPFPTDTGTPLDDVFTQINDAIAMFQGAAGGGETSDGGPFPTDTGTPLDDVFTQINDAIASFQGGDSSGGGTPTLTDGLDMVGQAIIDNAADTPLQPVGETVLDVSDGVGALGDVLAMDDSALAPATNQIGGFVGGSDIDEFGGVPGTVTDVGDGLNTLTSGELAPLAAVVEPLDGGLNTLSAAISDGADQLAAATEADPSGVTGLISEVLGGESTAMPSSGGDAGFSPDMITGALPIGSDSLPPELASALDPVLSQLG